ncbi:AAA family ATPase [Roseburia intestinalis]|uniref:AAA family ATPase n=1 Tax=Roseburia intestinalis TaxID=166486 RepID=UPI0032BF7857
MRLEIQHFSKIKQASIKLDGITVIAGENNTGKSTVGKILSCMFNSMYKVDEKASQKKKEQIESLLRYNWQNSWYHNLKNDDQRVTVNVPSRTSRKRYANAAELIMAADEERKIEIITELYDNLRNVIDDESRDALSHEVLEKVNSILNLKNEAVEQTLIADTFGRYFYGQMNDLYEPESEAKAILLIQGKKIQVGIKQNSEYMIEREISVMHEAISIDSPAIMDYMNSWEYSDGLSEQDLHLLQKLSANIPDNAIGKLMAEEKISDILKMLSEVTIGKVIKNEDGDFFLADEEMHYFEIGNLSMGIKAFTIIRTLLEKGEIHEKDVMVLDEPEIHLHPEWQLIYAELIVLLEKYLHLTILITTHSPYFLEAIETYTKKHNVDHITNYYLAQADGKETVMKDVTENLQSVYQLLAKPFEKLESIQMSK